MSSVSTVVANYTWKIVLGTMLASTFSKSSSTPYDVWDPNLSMGKSLAIHSWFALMAVWRWKMLLATMHHLLLHFGCSTILLRACSGCFLFTVRGRTRGSLVHGYVGWPSSLDAMAMVFPIIGKAQGDRDLGWMWWLGLWMLELVGVHVGPKPPLYSAIPWPGDTTDRSDLCIYIYIYMNEVMEARAFD